MFSFACPPALYIGDYLTDPPPPRPPPSCQGWLDMRYYSVTPCPSACFVLGSVSSHSLVHVSGCSSICLREYSRFLTNRQPLSKFSLTFILRSINNTYPLRYPYALNISSLPVMWGGWWTTSLFLTKADRPIRACLSDTWQPWVLQWHLCSRTTEG